MDTQIFVALFVVVLLFYAPSIWRTYLHNRKFKSIPTVGPSGTLSSYIGAVDFLRNGREMLKDGYHKYYGSIFKIPTLTSWIIVVAGGHLIDEMRRAPDDTLSSTEAVRQVTHLHLMFGREDYKDSFHAEAIRGPFTKNIGTKFDDVQDEIKVAFSEHIPVKGVGKPPPPIVIPTLTGIRMDQSYSVSDHNGYCMQSKQPNVCRDPDWMELNKQLTLELVKGTLVLGMFPAAIRPFVVPLLWTISRSVTRGVKHMEPLIRERLEQEKRHGEDWPERPNDLVSWFFDVTAKEGQRSTMALVRAMLITNFAAIHTTTMAVTYVLYELATRPEYIQPLREEIEAVIAEEGWSKDSVRKLRKLDSFIKECMRLTDFNVVTMWRKALKNFTFSNGTTVPAGSIVVVPYNAVHTDAASTSIPDFDGFRFDKMREKEGEDVKHQLTTLAIDFMLFGYGRHACPGRYFVVNEIKVMLAHVLLNYDIKMADGRGLPKNWQFGLHSAPDKTAQMLFRKRHEA